MDECPLCASVFCKRFPRHVRMVRHRTLWAVCRQQRVRCTISRCHVLACVAIPPGAHFWVRRLNFTHVAVLTLTIGNCCRKLRVGACSHSVRKVCVCRSMHAKCSWQGGVTFSENCFPHEDLWYSECYVSVLGIAFFVQGVCVCVVCKECKVEDVLPFRCHKFGCFHLCDGHSHGPNKIRTHRCVTGPGTNGSINRIRREGSLDTVGGSVVFESQCLDDTTSPTRRHKVDEQTRTFFKMATTQLTKCCCPER